VIDGAYPLIILLECVADYCGIWNAWHSTKKKCLSRTNLYWVFLYEEWRIRSSCHFLIAFLIYNSCVTILYTG
jgi:hypothetical protein